jgi:hypothetical protein
LCHQRFVNCITLRRMERISIAAAFVLGCAACSSGGAAADATMVNADVATTPSLDAPAAVAAACDPGSYATSISSSGEITCTPFDEATAVAVRSRCSVYLGQHDSCDGCADAPTKWAKSTPLACTGSSCVSATLDDPNAPVELATVDLDGDVNDDDKLYAGLHCITAPRPLAPAPCAPGWAITERRGDAWWCAPISEAAVGYVRSQCAVYLGWSDSCDGCTTPPAKWGHANDVDCASGAGGNGTCSTATLDGEAVKLYGLNTDGDVDGNDKFHIGLSCATASASGSATDGQCPAGQFVIGVDAAGKINCGDPSQTFADYLATHCSLFFGWRDSCDACTAAPTKWGKVSIGSCANGAGADDTCTTMTLGGASVQMFGLSPDGNVNGDDTLYIGFRCKP